MMSFCKKSVHSLLGLVGPMNVLDSCSSSTSRSDHKPSCKCLPDGGLGLVTATGLTLRIPNVLESSTMKPSPSSSCSSPGSCKKDPGGIGFIDDIGGGVDGLMSCTESLGFESSDERRVDDEIESMSSSSSSSLSSSSTTVKWRKPGERRRDRDKVKKFPPPITSLNHNGHPNFFLRPVRRDGRLELTEVRIDRPEILRAFREDGRLRLHLVAHEEEDEEEIDIGEEEELEHEQEVVEKQDDNENVNEEEEKEEGKLGEWSFPVTGDGFRRCHDHHNQHHSNRHHNLHVWTPHCVTTR